ncbi:6-methylsalicylate decarboxylase [Frankia sp. AiPs1]|uniref:amidohydrolase family protein n=1 Tax=Frankia sp. AiPa1 TaxID=573492 RepID=UPI00202B0570|nr:amidohydrolase family protein [Frankia sp. AiPa1]MCL9760454.1 amidohydrolase family protein [Frankia sp. AiPa1]
MAEDNGGRAENEAPLADDEPSARAGAAGKTDPGHPGRRPSRRAAVGAAAVGVFAAPGVARAATGASGAATGRIDVHHHAMTPQVRAWLVAHGQLPPVGGPLFATWSLEATLDTMDRAGIALALLSAAIPAEFTATPALAAELARLANDGHADLVRSHPNRFGLLAYIPHSTADIAVAEIRRVYDTLHPDGVLLMAHDGLTYLGDPTLAPMMAELNARDAVVLVHPYNLPASVPSAVPPFVADFLADTTRAAVQLIVRGELDRYPRIRWILAHGGGYLPYQAARLSLGRALGYGVDAGAVRAALRRFYVDTAGPMSPYSTPTLLATVGTEHILYGSDYNAVPADSVLAGRDALLADPALDASARRRVARDNALALFPALAPRLAARS